MSDSVDETSLENRYYCSLILRLTLDQWGRLIQGELVDTTDTLHQRFTNLSGLNEAVVAWFRQQERTDED